VDTYVRPQIYSSMPVHEVESQLRRDKMPAPFIRRMRLINLLSAVTLRKIEDDMIAPFDVMDIHHILDAQISQDSVIEALENKKVALALETGNMQPLWVESKGKPLLRKGFEQGWIQRFNTTPFDPICVMLAMRAKLLLDVVDELGHSYNLLRSIGMGWIDFGDIPGEEAGDPDSYVPPLINTPIDYPDLPPGPVPGDPDYVPGPGEPGYIPPEDRTPGDPGYVPGPGEPGYIPPGDLVPGEPGYVPGPDSPGYIPPPDRVPGDPGYPTVPGESPDYPPGWDEAIHPGHPDYEPGPGERGYIYLPSPGVGYFGGDYGPGGVGASGGPSGGGGIYGGLAAPLTLGSGPGSLLGRGWSSAYGNGAGINCCLDYTDPEAFVGIEYETTEMNVGEEQTLSVHNAPPTCEGDNYEWLVTAGGGELSALSGLSVTYTSPASGHGCPGNTEITLYCGGEVMATLDITMFYAYVIDYDYGTSAETIARETSENIYAMANNTPLTWAVSGTGFSLEHAETEGLGNVLHADETACGPAEITVTGCDGQSATGYVRCTTGHWGGWIDGCKLSGVPDTKTVVGHSVTLYKTSGKYKQEQYVQNIGSQSNVPCSSCPAGNKVDCLEWSCADMEPVYWFDCEPYCCGAVGSECNVFHNCFHNGLIRYAEWIC